MTAEQTASRILDANFLEMRHRLIELAAAFDRIDRGQGSVAGDDRYRMLLEAVTVLSRDQSGRCEQVQMVFSDPYHGC